MIPCDSYMNSGIKNVYFMNVRNIEGGNPSQCTYKKINIKQEAISDFTLQAF